MPSAPSSPLTPSVFPPTPVPPSDGATPTPTHRRNRAGSTSGVDLTPYRLLLTSLEETTGGDELGGKEGEVKGALRMLLDHVDGLTTRLHASLAKQLDTEHQLTIARSNLVMQEANAEMLEEALRRGGEFSHALIAQTHRRSAPPAAINTSQPSGMQSGLASPVLIERRSTDLATHHEETSAAATTSSSSGGGWFSRRTKSQKNGFSPIPPSISNTQHSPPLNGSSSSSPRRSNDIMNSHFAASSQPNLGLGIGPISPSSMSSPSTTLFAQQSSGEIISLKQSLAQEKTQRIALGTKLAALQASKAELEEELEGLSQALFEEANKMVADERRVRLEKEEEADEARGERDILRQTVRVVEEDCASLRKIVESLGARLPDLKSNSTAANTYDLTSSPTPSTSSLPPIPSPSSRRRAGPPKTLLLSPTRGAADIMLSSPSPTSPNYRRSGGSPRSSVDGGSDGGGSPRRKGKGVLPLSPRAQKHVDALGRAETSDDEGKRASASPSIESLDRLMLDMRKDLGSSALDTPKSASFPHFQLSSNRSPSPSPSRPDADAAGTHHLSPSSSPRPQMQQRDSGSEGNPWS